MMWLLSTQELQFLYGRLVHIKLVCGSLSDRAANVAADIALEIWQRTGTPPDDMSIYAEKREIEAGRQQPRSPAPPRRSR
jgi:hypothetical protein